jgi:hypothetical protein
VSQRGEVFSDRGSCNSHHIFYILPWVGLGLLDTARDVAAFDLPRRVLALLRGGS